ncbi:MAG: tRNA 2-selenouridine(34) synthase MnmH [Verrucomicrobiales bacterium]
MRALPRVHPGEITDLDFDEIIDVRSPSEFIEDHIPGALNLPVLSDSERVQVGTVYKNASPFEARRLGAGLVSANIACHLNGHLASKGRDFQPLLYCWRGGERSGAMATVLAAVGWHPHLLDGGYKAYRNFVRESLAGLVKGKPPFRVIAGLTGSGKTWLLERLEELGEQVLDLEAIAAHRGSALGEEPEQGQPAQKRFETLLLERLCGLDRNRPVYIESESSRIGCLQIPDTLWSLMKEAPVIEISVPRQARAAYLLNAYPHFTANANLLREKLEPVKRLQPRAVFAQWEESISCGDFLEFVQSMLEHHYDPAYRRSREKTYMASQAELTMDRVSRSALDALARDVIQLELSTSMGCGAGN